MIHPAVPLPLPEQKSLLLTAGCEGRIWEIPRGPTGRKQIDKILLDLSPDSTLFVAGLEAFDRSLPELLRTFRGLVEIGVTVRLASGGTGPASTIEPARPVVSALTALATYAASHRHAAAASEGGKPARGGALSEIQTKYARRLFDDGESLRTIGLIFRVSPDDVWRAIGR